MVATDPNEVTRWFEMVFQNWEAENLGLITVEPPAYSADIVVTDTAFI